jgi:NAD(P)-dependent dehydrogenase (short-subunit alcohol dehydrogenase family)
MGRALARRLVASGQPVCLLGRHPEDLEKSVTDLRVRGGREDLAAQGSLDLADPDTFPAGIRSASERLGGLDLFVITAAEFGTQEELEADPAHLERLLRVNFTNTVLLCEAVRKHLLATGGGRLCVFSSVAGDRGRKPVILYGSAKAGLSRYLEGLDHRYRAEGLITTCVKPGFVRTTMTKGLPEPPFAGDPDAVARRVLRAVERGRPVVYAPAIWRWIMLTIRLLPRFVMRRIGF